MWNNWNVIQNFEKQLARPLVDRNGIYSKKALQELILKRKNIGVVPQIVLLRPWTPKLHAKLQNPIDVYKKLHSLST